MGFITLTYTPTNIHPSKLIKNKNSRRLPTQAMYPIILKEGIKSQTSFSLRLHNHLLSQPGFRNSNFAFSPISLHSVLGVLTAGSTGPTLQQLLSFLGFNDSSNLSNLHSHVSNILLADDSSAGGPSLRYACGVWVDDQTNLKKSFREIAGSVYKAVGYNVPFRSKPEVCRDQINKWIEQATTGRIKNLLAPGLVTEETRLVLGNALYFNGTWEQKFIPQYTETRTFHLIDGSSTKVPFMHGAKNQYISVYDEFKVLKMPYKQNKDWRAFSCYIFLPNTLDGLLSLSEKLSSEPDFLHRHIPTDEVPVGNFRIPKFNISKEIKFSESLRNLGLILPFQTTGDFSEMVDSLEVGQYCVSEIAHKCFVGVDEEGTEAAAASAVIMSGCAPPMKKPIDFVADHPFLFMIQEDKTGTVLFVGHVSNPKLT